MVWGNPSWQTATEGHLRCDLSQAESYCIRTRGDGIFFYVPLGHMGNSGPMISLG